MSWSKYHFRINNIYSVPTIYSCTDFAQIVQKAFFEVKPECIAIELPDTLLKGMVEGINRLPYLSVLTFGSKENIRYIPITPCNPLIEAIRLAQEFGVELYFVDKDIPENSRSYYTNSNDYCVLKAGFKNFYNIYKKRLRPPRDKNTYLKELGMAHQVQKMSLAYKKVLFVYHINRHEIISALLQDKNIPQAKDNAENKEYDIVELKHLPKELYNNIASNMPFLYYLYELSRKGLNRFHTGLDVPRPKTNTMEDETAEQDLAAKAFNIATWISTLPTKSTSMDYYDCLHDIMIYAQKTYKKYWGDIRENAVSTSLRLARNASILDNCLAPSPEQIIMSAKNTINDKFALELYRIMSFYPFENNYNSLPVFEIKTPRRKQSTKLAITPYFDGKEPWINDNLGLKKENIEQGKGLWESVWEKGGLISYTKEDIRAESYFAYLRDIGRKLVESKVSKTKELSTSLLDGLDIRETLRNIPMNKIFLKEQSTINASIGNVVILFDRLDSENKYENTMTWYAEGIRESDIMLYSTTPGKVLVGPGMSLVEYGGLLSIYPPKSTKDIWNNKKFSKIQSKGDTLLLAAIHLSEKKYIICVSDKAPSRYFYSFAWKRKKAIIHIPISMLSPYRLTNIKFFHCLSSKKLRSIAYKYIKI